jgi:Amt family ammonium transporter
MTCNGLLAGLVAITAPCAFVAPWGAAIIGTVAGALMYGVVIFMERKAKIDDPVGAIAVHGANGLWGLLAVGLFADGSYGAGLNGVDGGVTGLLVKHGSIDQLLAQIADSVVLIAWCSLACVLFFGICKRVGGGMRVTAEEELTGLDMPLMGSISYPDFQEAPPANVLT